MKRILSIVLLCAFTVCHTSFVHADKIEKVQNKPVMQEFSEQCTGETQQEYNRFIIKYKQKENNSKEKTIDKVSEVYSKLKNEKRESDVTEIREQRGNIDVTSESHLIKEKSLSNENRSEVFIQEKESLDINVVMVYDNVVYYLNYDKLLKISNNEKKAIKENIVDTFIGSEKIIYSDFDGNMYECDMNGENSRLIISKDVIYQSGMYNEQITDNMQVIDNILLYNDRIYFILKNSPDEGGKMYSCDIDGNNLTYYEGNYTYAFQLQIVNNKIYYTGLNNDEKSKFALYEYDMATQNINKLRNGISSFCIVEDRIYFYCYEQEIYKLKSIDFQGLNEEEIDFFAKESE